MTYAELLVGTLVSVLIAVLLDWWIRKAKRS